MNDQQQEQFLAGQVYAQQAQDQIFKTILDNEDLIQLLEHEFKGEVYVIQKTESGEEYGEWIKKYNPIMHSEAGINQILRILRSMGLNKVTLLTSLEYNQINEKLKTFECKLADLLFLKRKEWGIKKEEMPMIYHQIWSLVEDALFRARDGNLIKVLKTNYNKTEQEYIDKTRMTGTQSSIPIIGGLFK